PEQLGKELLSTVSTRRLTVQRLIVERQLKEVPLDWVSAKGKPSYVNLLWTQEALGALNWVDVGKELRNPDPRVREQALRLVEPLYEANTELIRPVRRLADDPSPRVRFQLALSLWPKRYEADQATLVELLQEESDPWIQTAALCSLGPTSVAVI